MNFFFLANWSSDKMLVIAVRKCNAVSTVGDGLLASTYTARAHTRTHTLLS